MKQTIRKLLPRNRFARSVSILAGGTATAQGIIIVASPLLTRLYSPEDFGLLAVYAALLGLVGVVASLRYQMAIPLPKDDEEAAHIVVLSLLIVLAMCLFTALIVLFWSQSIEQLVNTPGLASYLWLLPVGIAFLGSYQVFNYWAIRTQSFVTIARTRLIQSASMVLVQIAGYAFAPLSLIVGQVSGHAAGTSTLALLAIRNRWSVFRSTTIHDVIYAALRYKRFPIFSTWGGVFNTAGSQLPPLLFAALFSPAAAGVYMIAHRVLAMPMKLVGRAVADVFFSRAAEARRNGDLAQLVAGIHEKLTHIAMPPALVLILAGPDLFALVFGDQWRQAGEFAQWMAPWVFLVFVTSPLSVLYEVLEKQAQGMLFQGILLVTRISGLVVGALYDDIMLAVALFTTGSALCWLGFLVWILYASGNNLNVLWRASIHSLAWSIFLVIPVATFYALDCSDVFWLPTVALSAILVAGRYFVLLKKEY